MSCNLYTDCKPEVSVVPDLLLTICDRLNCEIGDIVEIVERRNGKA